MANTIYKNKVQKRKAIRQQHNKYQKKNLKAYTFKFHRKYDEDVINKLDKVDNRVDYVRQLIRRD